MQAYVEIQEIRKFTEEFMTSIQRQPALAGPSIKISIVSQKGGLTNTQSISSAQRADDAGIDTFGFQDLLED